MYRHGKKIAIGVIGVLVLLLGIVMIPYPGPGWLVVIAGMGILSTEFIWAKNLREFTVKYYDRWLEWYKRQNLSVKIIFAAGTCAVVLLSIWLVNGYGLVVSYLELPYDWLMSPLFRS